MADLVLRVTWLAALHRGTAAARATTLNCFANDVSHWCNRWAKVREILADPTSILPSIEPISVEARTAYPLSAASARVRVGNFQLPLREQGIRLEIRPSFSQPEYDLLVSSAHAAYKASAVARSTARSIRTRRPPGLLMVHRLVLLAPFPGVDPPRQIDAYDFDDDLLVGSPADGNRRFQWLKREAERAVTSIRRARLVIAANTFLADRARPFNVNVHVIPSCVDPCVQELHEHAERDVITIGWIGSHTTVAYLEPVLPVIAQLNADGPRARLVVVGGDTGLRAEWIEHRPWGLTTQNADLASFDVGIMPLPDTEWTRGKSGYKLLQYFAAGVPAIASPVGLNTELVSAERGLLAATADDWKRALIEMLNDVDRRRANGDAAREFVEREYSYQRWAPELADLLRSLG